MQQIDDTYMRYVMHLSGKLFFWWIPYTVVLKIRSTKLFKLMSAQPLVDNPINKKVMCKKSKQNKHWYMNTKALLGWYAVYVSALDYVWKVKIPDK